MRDHACRVNVTVATVHDFHDYPPVWLEMLYCSNLQTFVYSTTYPGVITFEIFSLVIASGIFIVTQIQYFLLMYSYGLHSYIASSIAFLNFKNKIAVVYVI